MVTTTIDDLHQWINGMMKNLNISDYKLDIGGNTMKGDGYLGEVTFLKVDTKKNGTKKQYNLVVKSAKKSEELRKQTPVKEAYDRESYFYNTLFPIFDKFQKDCNVEKPFSNLPKCYCVSNELTKEAVILENLKSSGFELHDRQKPMNLDHVLLVFKNYGRYHALSLAYKLKFPTKFQKLTENCSDIFGLFFTRTNMMDLVYQNFADARKNFEKHDLKDVLRKTEGLEKEFETVLVNFTNEETVPSVLLHGDCWNNNFMFKYEGNNKSKPIEMHFLDFQLARVASPIIDLSYFLYCVADATVLKEFDFILQAYHSSLSDSLAEFDLDVENVVTYKELKEQWKEYGKFGLFLSLFIMKISLCDSDEAPDLMDSAENGGDFKNSLDINMKNIEEYERRIRDVYTHFTEKFM